jgi:hypothetical protein
MRNVPMTRSEAELLTDLLMDSKHHDARSVAAIIRDVFGMVSEDVERARLEEIRRSRAIEKPVA